MALAKMTFDELNQLVGYKVSEPYYEYYEPMKISREQKRKRIELAERLDEVFLAMLMECFYAEQYDTIVSSDIVQRTRDAYIEAISESVEPDEYLYNHGIEVIVAALTVLYKHRNDPFYFSEDRARAIAEGDSNSVFNYTEYEEAARNKRYKTWNTIMDGHERDSHAEVNGTTLPIGEPFTLRGGQVQFPRDDSMSVSDDEICGCRCSLSFS